jgi:hypothetical protein
MKKVIRLTESDLTRIIKRVISEQPNSGMFGGEPSTGKPTPTRTSTPTTGQAQKPTTGQVQKPTTGQAQGQSQGQSQGPIKTTKSITPKIDIDCVNKVIVSSQLPKLPGQSNMVIINHYCSK